MKSELIIVAVGGNLPSAVGNVQETLNYALSMLPDYGLQIIEKSSWWRTPAVPAESGPDFLNAVFSVKCTITHEAVMEALHRVEEAVGRVRQSRWEPRICDLDLIVCGETIAPDRRTLEGLMGLGLAAMDAPAPDGLVLPHPRMHERAFVLGPMAEIAPDWRHPILGRTVSEMLAALPEAEVAAMERL